MSDEKIDLAEIAREAWSCDGTHPDKVLALVRAVRAARVIANGEIYLRDCAEVAEFDAALAPFTDSAEVRSDGE